MKKLVVVLLLLGCFLMVGCGKDKEPNNNDVINDKWPNSETAKYIPVFIAGEYVSGECGDTDCEIIFKNVELASFEEYAAGLISRGFVVNGGRRTENKKEIYEASNEKFAYIKAVYDRETSIITINSSVKGVQ